jgi:hypothetical protein
MDSKPITHLAFGQSTLDRFASLSELAADCGMRWSDLVRMADFWDPPLLEPYDEYRIAYHSACVASSAKPLFSAQGLVPATLREVFCIVRSAPQILQEDRTVVVYGSPGRFGCHDGYPNLILHGSIPYISFLPASAVVGVSSIILVRASGAM